MSSSREQFRSKGKVQGGSGMEDDEDDDDEDYNDEEEASSSSDDDDSNNDDGSDDGDDDEAKSGKRKGSRLENGSAEHDRDGLENGGSGGNGAKSPKLSGKKEDVDSGDGNEMSDSDASPPRDGKAVAAVEENGQQEKDAGSENKPPAEVAVGPHQKTGGTEGVVPNGVASNKHDRDNDDADAAGTVSAKRKGKRAPSSSEAGEGGRVDMDYSDANGAMENDEEAADPLAGAIQKVEQDGGEGADEAACRRCEKGIGVLYIPNETCKGCGDDRISVVKRFSFQSISFLKMCHFLIPALLSYHFALIYPQAYVEKCFRLFPTSTHVYFVDPRLDS